MKKNKDCCKNCGKIGKPPYFLDEKGVCFECQMEAEQMEDMVNHPSHYTKGGIECIDAMKSMMYGAIVSAFIAYCWGASFKYLWRWHYKGKPIQDLEKAKWYINKMIEKLKEEDEVHSKNKT